MSTVVAGDFEWNAAKAESNLAKHGVSFPEAAIALADPNEVPSEDPSDPDNVISLVMSPRARVLLVVTTERGDRTRIISARKAETHEKRRYAQG